MIRRKHFNKWVFVFAGIAIVAALFFMIGKHHENTQVQQQAAGKPIVWSAFQDNNLDKLSIEWSGRKETGDTPYGFNAGVIHEPNAGEAILLLPGTACSFDLDCEYKKLELCAALDQRVADISDGCVLSVELTDLSTGESDVLKTEKISGKPSDFVVDIAKYYGKKVHVKFHVSNEDGHNENGDWVVISQFKLYDSSFGADGYVRSATYFGDAWPLNFWSSEMTHLDEDMQRIHDDGFNSVVLIIPWREFQPETAPVRYNTYAFERLDQVVDAAARHGLDVYTRIGYTWDFCGSDTPVNRYADILRSKDTRNAWLDYVSMLSDHLKQHDNFKGGFMVWEDFWGVLGMCDDEADKRLSSAKDIGYQEWVRKNYSLDEYNKQYGFEYSSYEDISLPQRKAPDMYAMYQFMDDFLLGLLTDSQDRLDGLSMEVRMDWDSVTDKDGQTVYYKHDKTYTCANAPYTATMYGIPMGFENKGERVSAMDALTKTDYILGKFAAENGGKPVYVEQFVFADNTPAFSRNAQIRPDQVNDYLLRVSDVLKKYTRGYGIWTYRDYEANLLYNPQFALGQQGWEFLGNAATIDTENGKVCRLQPTGKIKQDISPYRIHFPEKAFKLTFKVCAVRKAGRVSVMAGDVEKIVRVTDSGMTTVEFDGVPVTSLSIGSVDADIDIDDIIFSNHVQNGFLYDVHGAELGCIGAMRKLNNQF